jgi:TRAP-type C4-dicarboxylate transport system permease small subunit
MMIEMKRFRDAVFKIDDIMCMLANLCIVINMTVVVLSVIGRMVFKSPFMGLTDLVSFVFGLSCVLAFCYTEKTQGHIKMDLLMERLPPAGKKVLHVIIGILNLGCIALIAALLFRYTATTFASKAATWIIKLPYYPVVFVAAVGMTLFFITALVNFIDGLGGWGEE